MDGAALRVFEMDENQCPGRIVRCGYPRDRRLIEHPYLSSYNLVIGGHPELLAERGELLAWRRTLARADRRVLEINARLKQIRVALAAEEERAIARAAFVATTVSKAIADATLYEGAFDAVLFDEASMAYIPQIAFAAGLARERFICIGDFAQLPPIVQSGSESVLKAPPHRTAARQAMPFPRRLARIFDSTKPVGPKADLQTLRVCNLHLLLANSLTYLQ